MTFIIKKYEDSRKDYDKILSKLEHDIDKRLSELSRQIPQYAEKYPLYNSPLF